jgi:hypothetical protein
MFEHDFPPEAVATASLIGPELPQSRQVKKEYADTAEVKIIFLSPGDQQLAYLPEEIAEKVFANLAAKNIPAL